MMGTGPEEQDVQQQQQQQQQVQQPKKNETKAQGSQDPEKLAPIQVQNKQKTNIFSSSNSNTAITNSGKSDQTKKPEELETKKEKKSYKVYLGDVPVCRLCKRKFNDDYSINLHEKFSKLHKVRPVYLIYLKL